MSTPYKMKGFSGFGNSPLRQDKKDLPTTPTDSTTTTKSDTAWTEVPGSRTTELMGIDPKDTTTINSMRQSMDRMRSSGGTTGERKSRMMDAFKDEFPE